MGSSAKKNKEKKQDFTKQKLKVGKKRPTNTNATDTSFAAKSIVFKQQSVSESRDAGALFNHNVSLLSSKSETQRRDALQFLTTACITIPDSLPQPASAVMAKAQPLILDGNSGVRFQLLKLLKALPSHEIGPLDQILLYTRAGMAHLSTDIRLFSLDILNWLLESQGEAIMAIPGGWAKTLRTFENLLGWHGGPQRRDEAEKWRAAPKTSSGMEKSGGKLFVHQLNTLASFLAVGLMRPPADEGAVMRRAAETFPLWHTDVHALPQKGSPFGYLNLFGAPRDAESEIYPSAEERIEVFSELGFLEMFEMGVREAKREAGEIGRAAANVEKALKLVDID